MPGAKRRIRTLTGGGVGGERILDLSKYSDFYDEEILAKLEKHSMVTAAYIIQSDRNLRKKPAKHAYGYLCRVWSAVSGFLSGSGVTVVFSEATWAYELVTCAVCASLGIEFIVPHSVRVPAGRFAFFRGIFQNDIVRMHGFASISKAAADDAWWSCGLVNRRKAGRFFSHLRSFITGDERDETTQNVFQLVLRDVSARINAALSGFASMPLSVGGKYVYLPLHVQPEASIDVLGGFYSDQLWLVRAVSKALPSGCMLAVKEHPAGIGRRPYGFFREIGKLPNVVCVSPAADSETLIRGAEAVVSVSGTACYEAALIGVGSVVFSDVFFGEMPSVVRCRSYEDIMECIAEAMENAKRCGADSRFHAEIAAISYAGCVEPANRFPCALSNENARLAAEAFSEVLRYYSSSSGSRRIAASISSRCS